MALLLSRQVHPICLPGHNRLERGRLGGISRRLSRYTRL
jgi:hypothetical protein